MLLLLARLDTRALLRIDLLAGEVDLGAEGDDNVDEKVEGRAARDGRADVAQAVISCSSFDFLINIIVAFGAEVNLPCEQINPKQHARAEARQQEKHQALGRLVGTLAEHGSRASHAKRRQRGLGGRFLGSANSARTCDGRYFQVAIGMLSHATDPCENLVHLRVTTCTCTWNNELTQKKPPVGVRVPMQTTGSGKDECVTCAPFQVNLLVAKKIGHPRPRKRGARPNNGG